MPVTYDEAKRIVMEYLSRIKIAGGIEDGCFVTSDDYFVIVEEATIVLDYGWVFYYNTHKFLITEDFSYFCPGNGPILIEKETGERHVFGSGHSTEHYLAKFEQQRKL